MYVSSLFSFLPTKCMLCNQAEKDGITLTIDKMNQLDNLFVDLDEIKFGQVITNLIGNAFKFTSRGGSITMSVSYLEVQQRVVISVADTGIGIAPVRIFIN